MKPSVILLAFLIHIFHVNAQKQLSGVVIDAENGQPIQYASIGVVNTTYGTVADAGGRFSITLNERVTDQDTIKFSSIGYQNEGFLIADLKQKIKRRLAYHFA